MRGIINDIIDNYDGDMYDAIVERCSTYKDYGQLLTECLEWFSGADDWDYKAAEFLEEFATACYEDALEMEYRE